MFWGEKSECLDTCTHEKEISTFVQEIPDQGMTHGAERLSDAAGERREEARWGSLVPTVINDSVDANAEAQPRGLEHGEKPHAVEGYQKDDLNERT